MCVNPITLLIHHTAASSRALQKWAKCKVMDLTEKVQVLEAVKALVPRQVIMDKLNKLDMHMKNEAQILKGYDSDKFADNANC